MSETAWKPDPTLLQELADEAARRLAGNPPDRVAVFRDVARAVPREHRQECVSAIAHELSMRGQIKRAMHRPDAPAGEDTLSSRNTPSEHKQTGFGFGEGPRTKIRPPTRRHL